jgi:hypothetical protein
MTVPRLVDGIIDTYVPCRDQWPREGRIMYFGLHVPVFPERLDGAERIAAYFRDPRNADGTPRIASTHFTLDANSTVRCADDDKACASARGINHTGIHVEITGYADQTTEQWTDRFSRRSLARCARLFRLYHEAYDLRPTILSAAELRAGTKTGLVKHSTAWEVFGGDVRTDPGEHFPDELFVAMCRDEIRSEHTMDVETLDFDQWHQAYNAANPKRYSSVVEFVQRGLRSMGLYGDGWRIDGRKGPITDAAWANYEGAEFPRRDPAKANAHAGQLAWSRFLHDLGLR